MGTAPETWDVRQLLDGARQRQRDEDAWIEEHKGALSASRLGGCIRQEKFRLMGAERAKEPTPQTLRRWRWGVIYQQEVWRQALNEGRRPKKEVRCEVEVEGQVIRGFADLVFSEGVVEIKTSSAWEMHADHLPFNHTIQLGTYMVALDRPGQLLYGNFHNEWSFDFPAVPPMWEPWVREVARLFRENVGDDPRPFPPERLYCSSCTYEHLCPTDKAEETGKPLSDLEVQIVEMYLKARELATASGKEEEAAKARLLGLREIAGTDAKGTCRLRLPGRMVLLKQGIQERTDYSALDAKIKALLPKKQIVVNTIVVERE